MHYAGKNIQLSTYSDFKIKTNRGEDINDSVNNINLYFQQLKI